MSVDLKKKLVFPNIIHTTLRPDIILSSEESKAIVMIELTVPWETRCDEAHERKKAKYFQLQEECKAKGWKCWPFPVEIGARAFPGPAQSLCVFCRGNLFRPRSRSGLSLFADPIQ